MGTYLNPGNAGFSDILNGEYVDKTGLIALVNESIDTPGKLSCVSRPRRFGKSFAAKMLCAYYDKSCDSRGLFEGLEIASSESYEKHLNKYDVIYLDMSNILEKTKAEDLTDYIKTELTNELTHQYPEATKGSAFDSILINVTEYTGNKFVMIIDEWDAPIRETPQIEKEYLMFLRMLFKSSGTTPRIFSAVYMTGILPIKKDGSQSALSDFQEYTMTSPADFASYVGFTEEEVRALCKANNMDFEQMKHWYDGYNLRGGCDIYNPNSVMQAIKRREFESYWVQSSAADNLLHYISFDFDGLSKTTAELVGGADVEVNVNMFDNDLVSFRNKDSVLTLLIHLGYLTYNSESKKAHIPNEEIRIEFNNKIKEVKKDETIKRIAESDKLIENTIHMNEEAVAAQIEKVHLSETTPLFYNSEQTLRSVVKLAYFAYRDYYVEFEELAGGAGYADLVYFPKAGIGLPALLIEFKWNKSAEGAIEQIKKKNYPEKIKEYGGEILLVGINYDKDAPVGERKHSCVIERIERLK